MPVRKLLTLVAVFSISCSADGKPQEAPFSEDLKKLCDGARTQGVMESPPGNRKKMLAEYIWASPGGFSQSATIPKPITNRKVINHFFKFSGKPSALGVPELREAVQREQLSDCAILDDPTAGFFRADLPWIDNKDKLTPPKSDSILVSIEESLLALRGLPLETADPKELGKSAGEGPFSIAVSPSVTVARLTDVLAVLGEDTVADVLFFNYGFVEAMPIRLVAAPRTPGDVAATLSTTGLVLSDGQVIPWDEVERYREDARGSFVLSKQNEIDLAQVETAGQALASRGDSTRGLVFVVDDSLRIQEAMEVLVTMSHAAKAEVINVSLLGPVEASDAAVPIQGTSAPVLDASPQ